MEESVFLWVNPVDNVQCIRATKLMLIVLRDVDTHLLYCLWHFQ